MWNLVYSLSLDSAHEKANKKRLINRVGRALAIWLLLVSKCSDKEGERYGREAEGREEDEGYSPEIAPDQKKAVVY